jgi:hypothetical protein
MYIGSNTSSLVKNCIFDGATQLEGVFSSVTQVLTYCCIRDGYSSTVDVSASSNIFDDPLFRNTVLGSENFKLQSEENGDPFDSPCEAAGDDGLDIGAYNVSYTVSAYSWRKYQFWNNPLTMDVGNDLKNSGGKNNILGAYTLFGDYSKRTFPMRFPTYTTEEQRLKIQYLNTFHPTRENGLSREETKMRLSILPNSFIETGTSATLNHASYWDSTDFKVRLTDTSKAWVENQDGIKGWHVGIKFDSATDAVINATAKTITKSGAFTGDDWTGYFVYIDGYYYYIASNTNDALTVLDPDSTLVSQTIDITVDKYFKIIENEATYMVLEDPDNELTGLDGTYDYYINFIEVVVKRDNPVYNQNRFSYTQQTTKSNYELMLEEA